MKQTFLVFSLMTLTIIGCKKEVKTEMQTPVEKADTTTVVPDMHTSEISLDWDGTYKGVIPCADCPGIETELTLNKDKTYELSVLYRDREQKPTVTKGTFTWNDAGSIIKLDKAGTETQYKVGEGRLTMLDHSGKEIESALKSNYILHKAAK
ncbi:MAG TPA: copper resistance protein NlpE [Flavobacterium sp.]|uniref:copper resistance protein NlpE n=1 Tax=Flavobacterium sp. TaxID=239 RepID=UPI002C1ACE76|nr:copper resistance protein NlpE [Flavobacterium sp.]HSD13822.1 copper resistance protein NlpE [Flavobacterium sp.]